MEGDIIRVLLVDDEDLVREDLRARLVVYHDVQVVGVAGSYQEAIAFLESCPVDAVFTDIQMTDGTGFALSRAIQQRWPGLPVVFLTGHSDFAVEGYDYQPLDFLVKPVQRERLERTLDRVRNHFQAAPPAEVSIALNTENGLCLFRPGDIICVEKTGRRVRILSRDGSESWASVPLQEIEDALEGHGFYRCHQSYLVSVKEIANIRKEAFGRSYLIALRSCDLEIPLSRRNYRELLELLKSH